MKLLSILKMLDFSTLESIREFWEIQSPPLPEKKATAKGRQKKMVEYLYPRLQIEQYFRQAFDKLGKTEKNLIYFLSIHGGDLEESEVAERCFGGDNNTLAELVKDLMAKGFVFYEDLRKEKISAYIVGIPEPYTRFIELPAYWEGYLGNFLKERSTLQLRSMFTEGLSLKPASTKKNYLLISIRRFQFQEEIR